MQIGNVPSIFNNTFEGESKIKMPRIQYREIKFQPKTENLIHLCEQILEQYVSAGYDMTLRQLYYQLVSRDIIPNKQSEYKRLGSIVNDARLAGMLDWDHIVDRTRNLRRLSSWDSPDEIIKATSQSYHLDKWERQRYRPEIWIEKDALVGVFERVANELDVPLFSCRGYTSQSEVWGAAQRMINYQEIYEQKPYILHFGDHDPSGIDMSRDITERLQGFGVDLEFDRLALNMKQVDKYDPPPNPAKTTDSRFHGYIIRYGKESWELDALEPNVLAELVRDAVLSVRDDDIYDEDVERESEEREVLTKIHNKFEKVREYVEAL